MPFLKVQNWQGSRGLRIGLRVPKCRSRRPLHFRSRIFTLRPREPFQKWLLKFAKIFRGQLLRMRKNAILRADFERVLGVAESKFFLHLVEEIRAFKMRCLRGLYSPGKVLFEDHRKSTFSLFTNFEISNFSTQNFRQISTSKIFDLRPKIFFKDRPKL